MVRNYQSMYVLETHVLLSFAFHGIGVGVPKREWHDILHALCMPPTYVYAYLCLVHNTGSKLLADHDRDAALAPFPSDCH